MKPYWDASRHEDTTTRGTPDVSWGSRDVNGWTELKVITSLPKNQNEIPKIKLRPAQKVFLLKRLKKGGHCSVLLEVSKTGMCFLFDKPEIIQALGTTARVIDLYKEASIICHDGLPEPERMIDVLTGHHRYGLS